MATKTAPSSSSSSSSRLCLCAPTTHPGSFRCNLHRRRQKASDKQKAATARGGVDWNKTDLVRAFLMQIIKPSSHDLQRRRNFQPKPSRFCNVGSDGLEVS